MVRDSIVPQKYFYIFSTITMEDIFVYKYFIEYILFLTQQINNT